MPVQSPAEPLVPRTQNLPAARRRLTTRLTQQMEATVGSRSRSIRFRRAKVFHGPTWRLADQRLRHRRPSCSTAGLAVCARLHRSQRKPTKRATAETLNLRRLTNPIRRSQHPQPPLSCWSPHLQRSRLIQCPLRHCLLLPMRSLRRLRPHPLLARHLRQRQRSRRDRHQSKPEIRRSLPRTVSGSASNTS
jgi:hypothetical protein